MGFQWDFMRFLNGFNEISQAMRMNGLLGGSSLGLEVMIKKTWLGSPLSGLSHLCIYIYVYIDLWHITIYCF